MARKWGYPVIGKYHSTELGNLVGQILGNKQDIEVPASFVLLSEGKMFSGVLQYIGDTLPSRGFKYVSLYYQGQDDNLTRLEQAEGHDLHAFLSDTSNYMDFESHANRFAKKGSETIRTVSFETIRFRDVKVHRSWEDALSQPVEEYGRWAIKGEEVRLIEPGLKVLQYSCATEHKNNHYVEAKL